MAWKSSSFCVFVLFENIFAPFPLEIIESPKHIRGNLKKEKGSAAKINPRDLGEKWMLILLIDWFVNEFPTELTQNLFFLFFEALKSSEKKIARNQTRFEKFSRSQKVKSLALKRLQTKKDFAEDEKSNRKISNIDQKLLTFLTIRHRNFWENQAFVISGKVFLISHGNQKCFSI